MVDSINPSDQYSWCGWRRIRDSFCKYSDIWLSGFVNWVNVGALYLVDHIGEKHISSSFSQGPACLSLGTGSFQHFPRNCAPETRLQSSSLVSIYEYLLCLEQEWLFWDDCQFKKNSPQIPKYQNSENE